MRVLVTGRSGQVARCLQERAESGLLVFASRPELDLAEPASIERVVTEVRPDIVVSAAAYTAVDQAEDEPEIAYAVNGDAPGELARAAARVGAPIIHLSTDYVFDGSGDRPWQEEDPTGPLGVYGASKLAGEQAIQASGARHVILRTAWVYSPFGRNFVRTMLRLGRERERIAVVNDQFGCPTSAFEIADGIMAVIARWRDDPASGVDGVYHLAGTGAMNWANFARAIFAASERNGGVSAEVEDVSSAAYSVRARRPLNSRLDSSRFIATFDYKPEPWSFRLEAVVKRILAEG